MDFSLTLPEGQKMPQLGLGTWTYFDQRGGKEDVYESVKIGIETGYRHIDCAWIYQNQGAVGRAIAEKTADGTVKREDLFITTKLWNTHHNPSLVKKELQETLQQLQVKYVDLFLIHWPISFKDDEPEDELVPRNKDGAVIFSYHSLVDTWKGMEECVDEGLTKHIGISNFNHKQVQSILDNCRIAPMNLQVESWPYFLNQRLMDFCKSKGMTVTAYAPIGAPGRPWKSADEPNVLEDEVIMEIAKSKGKTAVQVLLRFHLQRGVCVLTKSIKSARIKSNFQIFDFELSPEEMKRITALDRNLRVYLEPIALGHPEYPFDEPY